MALVVAGNINDALRLRLLTTEAAPSGAPMATTITATHIQAGMALSVDAAPAMKVKKVMAKMRPLDQPRPWMSISHEARRGLGVESTQLESPAARAAGTSQSIHSTSACSLMRSRVVSLIDEPRTDGPTIRRSSAARAHARVCAYALMPLVALTRGSDSSRIVMTTGEGVDPHGSRSTTTSPFWVPTHVARKAEWKE